MKIRELLEDLLIIQDYLEIELKQESPTGMPMANHILDKALTRTHHAIKKVEDEMRTQIKFKVEWKEGYAETKHKIVSIDDLKQDHWNLDAYDGDTIAILKSLKEGQSHDVIGITDRVTFTKLG